MTELSIVIPARNEAQGLGQLLPALRERFPDAQILVVDDGSEDETTRLCADNGVTCVSHPYSMGNGAAIKTGARNARGARIVFMDGDGQHDPADIPALLEALESGFAMAVGARTSRDHANSARHAGNRLLNLVASFMTGHRIRDLTSGFRAVNAREFRRFLYLLPNGFSYPTTISMAFFRSGLAVRYVPVQVHEREGSSKIQFVRDGIKFLVIVLKIGALFSPMRLFAPISLSLAMLGLINYAYTWHVARQFTNMSALLFVSALLTFLIGILAEQVSSLHYRAVDNDNERLPPT